MHMLCEVSAILSLYSASVGKGQQEMPHPIGPWTSRWWLRNIRLPAPQRLQLAVWSAGLSVSSGVLSRRGEGPGCLGTMGGGDCPVLRAPSPPGDPEPSLGWVQGAAAGILTQVTWITFQHRFILLCSGGQKSETAKIWASQRPFRRVHFLAFFTF